MKRTSKPPLPPKPPRRPTPIPHHPADDDASDDPATVEVSPAELKLAHQQAASLRERQQQQPPDYPAHLHRPPEPTMPVTPAVEWEPIGPPTPPSSSGGYESTLREQIMSGIAVPPSLGPPSSRPTGHQSPRAPTPIPFPAPPLGPPPPMTPRGSQARLSVPHQQQQQQHPYPPPSAPTHTSGQLSEAWASAPSGSYSASGQREIASRPGSASASRPRPSSHRESSMPIGYVVASAFFLAIAVVGFGLYLAFEVISL